MDEQPTDPPSGSPPPTAHEPAASSGPETGDRDRPEAVSDVLPARSPSKDKGGLAFFKELPVLILIAFGLAMLIKTFFIQAFYIPSESMVPTLEKDDRVLVNKMVYRIRDPRRGEVVVFIGEHADEPRGFLERIRDSITEGFGANPGADRDFIKRVIGLPGETVRVHKDGSVTITQTDGATLELEEPYVAPKDPDDDNSFGPFTVPADSYFVMGDNRGESADSRSTLGPVPKSDVLGKAFVRIWPPSRFSFFRTPNYADAAAAGLIAVPLAALMQKGRSRARRKSG